MLGLVIVIAVIAAAVFLLLRYHPTSRYPAYVVAGPGRVRYLMRPRGINVWTRKERKRYLMQMALYNEMTYQRRLVSEMLIAERVGMSVHRPENFIKIAGV